MNYEGIAALVYDIWAIATNDMAVQSGDARVPARFNLPSSRQRTLWVVVVLAALRAHQEIAAEVRP